MQSDKWDGNVSWMTKLNEQNEWDVDHWTSNDYLMYMYEYVVCMWEPIHPEEKKKYMKASERKMANTVSE